MCRVVSCAALVALASILAGVRSAAPPQPVPPTAKAVRTLPLVDRMYAPVEFPGIDDPRTTLGEALVMLSKSYGVTFEVRDKAFKFEMLNDVFVTEVANPNPIPPMKARLAVVLERIVSAVQVPSGAVWLLRDDHVEITTGQWAEAETKGKGELDPDEEELGRLVFPQPLVHADFRKQPLSEALRVVADRTGVNIVVDEGLPKGQGRRPVTARLRNVRLDTAVLLLASQADLGMVKLDNVFIVTTEEKASRLARRHAELRPARPRQPAKKEPASEVDLWKLWKPRIGTGIP